MSALGIRTIIVATDLSDALIPAVQSSLRLARLTDARLHIIHTTETRIPESLLTNHVAAAGVELGSDIEARIVVGPPGALVVQEAARLEADVIVLGPHQPGKSRLGSTAYRVVLGSQTPCLMLPGELHLPVHRVLAPVDIASPPQGPLRVALTWASALRDRKTPTEFLGLFVQPDEQSADHAETLARELESICGPVDGCVGLNVRSRTARGVPAEVILDTAEQHGADLVIMGTRGESYPRDALGSVSREVISRAHRPVLLVPPAIWKRYENPQM